MAEPAGGGTFARAWRRSPQIAAFSAAMAEAASEDAAEAAVRGLFTDPCWIAATLRALATLARADPAFMPPFVPLANPLQQGLVLIDDAKVTIALSIVGIDALAARKALAGGRGSIGFDGGLALYRVLDGGGARIGWWETPPIDDLFDAGAAPRCRRVGEERLADGGWLRVDGRHQAFIVEQATRDLVLLQAIIKVGRAALRVEYDAVSGALVGTSATDPAASHAQMLMALLTLARPKDTVAAMTPWLAHPAFFLRWEAARALFALDRDAGKCAVRQLVDDPHGDVRRAAQTAIAGWDRHACRV